jgi:hypothetical protein
VTPSALLKFMRAQQNAVQASVSAAQTPQAAVVGVAVSDQFEVIFDTLSSTRKAKNIADNSRIAFVFGGLNPGDERTLQYEGVADVPSGAELERLKAIYYARFPDGAQRLSWPGLVYVRVRPTWLRFSDFNQDPPLIVEFDPDSLGLRTDSPLNWQKVYEAAEYRVQDYPHDFVIKVGQPCKSIDALCWDYSVASAIFITAYNPRSQRKEDRENQLAQVRLRQRLDELNAATVLKGLSVDPEGVWPPEPSFLALGLSTEEGRRLAADFGQNALLFIEVGQAVKLLMI